MVKSSKIGGSVLLLTVLVFVSITNYDSHAQTAGTWTQWQTVYQENGKKVQISFKFGDCYTAGGEPMTPYGYWRTNNELVYERGSVVFTFDYENCKGQRQSTTERILLSTSGLNESMGKSFKGYKILGSLYNVKVEGVTNTPASSALSFPSAAASSKNESPRQNDEKKQMFLEKANKIQLEHQDRSQQLWNGVNSITNLLAEMQRNKIREFARDIIGLRDRAFQELKNDLATAGGDELIECSTCHGNGITNCRQCGGEPFSSCQFCSGTGTINSFGSNVSCGQCYGQGKKACSNCSGVGFNLCPSCNGRSYTIQFHKKTTAEIAYVDVAEEITLHPKDGLKIYEENERKLYRQAEQLKATDLNGAVKRWRYIREQPTFENSFDRVYGPWEGKKAEANIAKYTHSKDQKDYNLALAEAYKLFYLRYQSEYLQRIALLTKNKELYQEALEGSNLESYSPSWFTSIDDNPDSRTRVILAAAGDPIMKDILAQKVGAENAKHLANKYDQHKKLLSAKIGDYKMVEVNEQGSRPTPFCKDVQSAGSIKVGLNDFLEYTYTGNYSYKGSKCNAELFSLAGRDLIDGRWTVFNQIELDVNLNIMDELFPGSEPETNHEAFVSSNAPFSSIKQKMFNKYGANNCLSFEIFLQFTFEDRLEVFFHNFARRNLPQNDPMHLDDGNTCKGTLLFEKIVDDKLVDRNPKK